MNKTTRTVLLIAVIYGVGLIGAYGYGISVVQSKGQELEDTRMMLAEQTAKEAAYNNLLRLIADTAEERAEIETYFLTERDTITFISETEQLARQLGLDFETTQLAITEQKADTNAELVATFRFAGSEVAVKLFLEMLELLPYHKVVPTINLSAAADAAAWRADVTLRITILP